MLKRRLNTWVYFLGKKKWTSDVDFRHTLIFMLMVTITSRKFSEYLAVVNTYAEEKNRGLR